MNVAGRIVVLAVALGSIHLLSRLAAASSRSRRGKEFHSPPPVRLASRIAVGGIAGLLLFEAAFLAWRHFAGAPDASPAGPGARYLSLVPYLGSLRAGGTGFAAGALAALFSRRWEQGRGETSR